MLLLAEAKAESMDLITLPTYGPSFWSRLKGLWTNLCIPPVSALAERVIRGYVRRLCGFGEDPLEL